MEEASDTNAPGRQLSSDTEGEAGATAAGEGSAEQGDAAGKTEVDADVNDANTEPPEESVGESPEDLEILERLKKLNRPRKKTSTNWDGRASGLTLKEYRERKWSLDAGFSATARNGPTFSFRPMLPNPMLPNKRHGNKVFQRGDVHKALHATRYKGPSWSMGSLPVLDPKDGKSPGPAQYSIRSTMDPVSHPTHSKALGARFGCETLLSKDNVSPPGPGEYDTEGYEKSSVFTKLPKWVIPGREAWNPRTEAPGPGPGEYKFESVMRNGKITCPEWTAQGKTLPIEPARGHERQCSVPPPGAYDPPAAPKCRNHYVDQHESPKFSFGREHRGLLT